MGPYNFYTDNKNFFKYIQQFKYEINKDENSNEILTINYDNKQSKFRYLQLFSYNTETKKVIWTYENPYSDQKTSFITKNIRDLLNKKREFDYNSIDSKDILELIKQIMKINNIEYQNKLIKPIWILNGDYKKYKQYYLITDIIYY